MSDEYQLCDLQLEALWPNLVIQAIQELEDRIVVCVCVGNRFSALRDLFAQHFQDEVDRLVSSCVFWGLFFCGGQAFRDSVFGKP
jgi:hypothetical protein